MYTLVVPFHNGDFEKLFSTIERLKREAPHHNVREIIFAHNGAPLNVADETRLKRAFFDGCELVHTDDKGIGAGYRIGIRRASQPYVILSASDLPFGWTDLAAFEQNPSDFAIGSKAHPQSSLKDLTFKRKVASSIFWLIRRVLLGANTPGDSQGSLIIKTSVAQAIEKESQYQNYLFSLEAICLFQKNGQIAKELPVVLENSLGESSVSVVRDGMQMVKDLWVLSRKIRASDF